MRVYITLALLLFAAVLFAQSNENKRTEIVARNFYYEQANAFKSVHYDDISVVSTETRMHNGKAVYTICAMNPSGFVIVSESEKVVPVLGYSFAEAQVPAEMNSSCATWLDNYAVQIAHVIDNQTLVDENIAAMWSHLQGESSSLVKSVKTGVTPMLFTQWNQGLYYNAMCPADGAGPGGHVVTGCVATALGQLLNYFRYPEQGTGSYGYQHDDYGWIEVDFSQQNYNYDQMAVELTDFNDDVARLIYNIGVSVDMNYGPDGSGMWNHKGAYTLHTYFGYDDETTYLFRDSLPEDFDWKGTLIQHLDQRIPLYYAGWSDYEFVSGHAFIVDGYQTEDYYHFNWGWGGSYDGYLYLDNLTPGGSDFTLLHEVIVNAVPSGIYPQGCQSQKILTTTAGTIDDGSGPLFDYEAGTECEWLIQPNDSANGIEFEFLKLQTDPNDFITIFDGPTDEAQVLGVFSGNTIPATFESTSDEVLIRFVTDNDLNGDGFLLSYKGIKPVYCPLVTHISEPVGTVSDGSNQYNYQNNTTCYWYIEPENAQSITVEFTDFDLEPVYDYVKILNQSSQTVATYSGSTLPDVLTIEAYKITVNFKANGNTRAGGFSLNYSTQFVGNPIGATENISVFPNPADNFIEFRTGNMAQPIQIELYDVQGKLLLQQFLPEDHHIDIGHISEGMYIYHLYSQDYTYQGRIVVQ